MTSLTSPLPPKRDIFLLVYQARLGIPSHWTMFIPDENGSSCGTKIHAIGAPFFGYGLEIKPAYDLTGTKRRHLKLHLGHVDEDKISELEEVAKVVPTPGASKTPLDPFGGEHCQHWLRKYVGRLILKKLMDKGVVRALDEAPTEYHGAA